MLTASIWLVWITYIIPAARQTTPNSNKAALLDITISMGLPTVAAILLTIYVNG